MPKRILQGVVVSDKNDKTVVVEVERRFTHPLFKKTVRRTKKYHAHDESNAVKVGERVWLQAREDARAAAGEAFDLKAWHMKALALGSVGLDVLRDELARA